MCVDYEKYNLQKLLRQVSLLFIKFPMMFSYACSVSLLLIICMCRLLGLLSPI
jgi:hypothetical protein